MRAVLFAMAGVMLVAAITAAAGLRRGLHAAADADTDTAGPATGMAGETAAEPSPR